MDLASRLGLIVLKRDSVSTFRRFGYRETIIDVSLATESLAARVMDWRVIEDYTASDHQYITFRVHDVMPVGTNEHHSPPRWNAEKMNKEKFRLAIERG